VSAATGVDGADRTGTHKGKWERGANGDWLDAPMVWRLKRRRLLNESAPVTLPSRGAQVTRVIRRSGMRASGRARDPELPAFSLPDVARIFPTRVYQTSGNGASGIPTIARGMKLNVISSGIHAGNDLEQPSGKGCSTCSGGMIVVAGKRADGRDVRLSYAGYANAFKFRLKGH